MIGAVVVAAASAFDCDGDDGVDDDGRLLQQ